MEVSEMKKYIAIILVLYMLAGALIACLAFYDYLVTPGSMREKVLTITGALIWSGFLVALSIDIASSGLLWDIRDVMCREEGHRSEAGGG